MIEPVAVSTESIVEQIARRAAARQPLVWRQDPLAEVPQPPAVDLSACAAVIDYPHDDMTITVQTGITVARLQEVLAEQQQWLPVDVLRPERMTVAELIVGHWYGSYVAGHGSIRDWLLGITAVDGAGRLFHAGGRVVKNVAGYDLCKLLVGSRGELAIPLEATLQVKSRPQTIRCLTVIADAADQLGTVWQTARELPLKPLLLDIGQSGRSLTFAIEGPAAATETLIRSTRETLAQVTGVTVSPPADSSLFRSPWADVVAAYAAARDGISLLRGGCLPSETIRVCALAGQLGWQSWGLASKGTVYLWRETNSVTGSQWADDWKQFATVAKGIEFLRGPESPKTFVREQLTARPVWPLMQQLKSEFDPYCLLIP